MGENTKYMLDDLAWLGLTFDGEVLYQSRRAEIYREYFDELQQKGLIYPCYCSRAELHAASAPHLSDNTPIYDRRCLLRAERGEEPPVGRKPAYRVKVPNAEVSFIDGVQGEYRENLLRDCSDFVVRRADGVFAYQLAVVVDDALSGVTEVVRGNDLLFSTPRQIYLQQTLGFSTPTIIIFRFLSTPRGAAFRSVMVMDVWKTCAPNIKTAPPSWAPLPRHWGFCPRPNR